MWLATAGVPDKQRAATAAVIDASAAMRRGRVIIGDNSKSEGQVWFGK
jgi:hypothetical protein